MHDVAISLELRTKVRRVALTRPYTRLTAAAGDPPDTNIVLGEYQATSENLPELNEGKPTTTEAKQIFFLLQICV